jgi:integrase
MASLSKDGNGWRILFVCPTTKKRRTIRTGKCAKKNAETALNMIERLVEVKTLGTPIDRQTAVWLDSIDGTLRERLAKAGLAAGRQKTELKAFVSAYIDSRHDVKPASKTVWRQGEASLYAFFGEDCVAHTISTAEAEEFKQSLIQQKLALFTVRKRLQGVRIFFNAMAKRGFIASNPFDDVKGVQAVVDESRNVYVSRENVNAVIEEAPDAEWRAMIALSRFGGLRLPSEVLSLKWQHIDWQRSRITVVSPKTEHHPGGGQREIPLFPELVRPLAEAFEAAPDGAVYVVTRHRSQADSPEGWRNSNLRTRFNKMIRRAGLKPWPKPFHAMRASCETDLLEKHPLQAVARWMGHSAKVAVANYLRVRDEHFDAATTGTGGQHDLAQIPAQSPHVLAHQGSAWNEESPKNQGFDETCGVVITPKTDGEGFEPPLDLRPEQFSRLPP